MVSTVGRHAVLLRVVQRHRGWVRLFSYRFSSVSAYILYLDHPFRYLKSV